MAELGAYTEDVKFNWAAADKLVSELRSTARVLHDQIGERKRIGGPSGAREHWEGSYAQQFDGRLNTCTGDAQHFVNKMHDAANDLEELARLARQEQQRRVNAREWVREQENKSGLEEAWDGFTSAIGFGEDVPPDVAPPIQSESKIPIHDTPSERGSSTPAGRT
ncbi:MAG: hypothetical protein ACRDUV_07265 [Pseudonocardiaceae bacterium]